MTGPRDTEKPTLEDTLPGARDATDEATDAEVAVGWQVDNRFLIRRLLAVGGMGFVYEAKDQSSLERVALKTLKPGLAESGALLRRFMREAATLQSIESPHVVEVVAVGRLPDFRPYYVMEFLRGRTLADVLQSLDGPMRPERAVLVARQIAMALESAHAKGIVHRDLKPANVLLEEGPGGDFVKIVDFGLAKAADGSQDVTNQGEVLGTPHYMAPEQIRGVEVDARTDIYASGVVLYEMLTGRMPFEGDAPFDIMIAHVERPVPLPSSLRPPLKLPALLEWIAMCCLYKEPEKRFESATVLREELENAARLYRVL